MSFLTRPPEEATPWQRRIGVLLLLIGIIALGICPR